MGTLLAAFRFARRESAAFLSKSNRPGTASLVAEETLWVAPASLFIGVNEAVMKTLTLPASFHLFHAHPVKPWLGSQDVCVGITRGAGHSWNTRGQWRKLPN